MLSLAGPHVTNSQARILQMNKRHLRFVLCLLVVVLGMSVASQAQCGTQCTIFPGTSCFVCAWNFDSGPSCWTMGCDTCFEEACLAGAQVAMQKSADCDPAVDFSCLQQLAEVRQALLRRSKQPAWELRSPLLKKDFLIATKPSQAGCKPSVLPHNLLFEL